MVQGYWVSPTIRDSKLLLDGRMVQVQVNQPDTQQVEYVFNAINRLVSITAPNETRRPRPST